MLSGRRLDLIDPSAVDVEIEDIAHGLARVARWNGQTRGDHPFSVAQHCLLVLEITHGETPQLSPHHQMMTLLHDAPEYVIGDMISPFKNVLGDGYRAVEERLQSAIHLRFALPASTPKLLKRNIKRADTMAAYFEAVTLAGFAQEEAEKFFGKPVCKNPPARLLKPMEPRQAQSAFLDAFARIEESRKRN